MGNDDRLTKRDAPPGSITQTREHLELDVRRQKVEAAVKVLDLIVHGGKILLNAHATQAEMAKNRQATEDAILLLDAQTQAELRKLEHALQGEHVKTERLRIIADLAATQENVNPVLAEAFAQALRVTFLVP